MSFEQWKDPKAIIVRGKLIAEMAKEDLLALYQQVSNDLPENEDDVGPQHNSLITQLELIEEEMDRR